MNTANYVFTVCLVAGGLLLLLSVVIGDVFSGVLDAAHLGVDVGGVSLLPLLLGFISMFGAGGLFSTSALGLGPAPATLIGAACGLVGSGIVFALFNLLKRSEGPEPFSLTDLIGQTARVSVGIPKGHFGTVQLSYGGQSHELTATSDVDIPAGGIVSIESVAGSNVLVAPRGAAGGREAGT